MAETPLPVPATEPTPVTTPVTAPAVVPASAPVAPTTPGVVATPYTGFNAPWLDRDEKGNWYGKGTELPENIPGTPEYEITKTERGRNENGWLFDRAAKVGFYNEDAAQAIFGVSASTLSAEGPTRAKQIEDASWGVLKVKRPEAEYLATQVTQSLIPFAKSQKEVAILRGVRNPPAFGMRDDELETFITDPQNQFSPKVISEVLRELSNSGYRSEKEAIGTSLVAKIRKPLETVDDQLVVGRKVAEAGPKYLDGLPPQEKRDAFIALARYNASRKTTIMGDGFNAATVFLQDGVEALAGFTDAINPFDSPDEYLSEKYRKNPELRAKAEKVIVGSSVIRDRIVRLREVQNTGNTRAFMDTLDTFTDADDPANQEFLSAIAALKVLREDGAFAPGMKGEKLASFGSGVLQSVVNFKHFVNDSVDPNSYLFLREAKADHGEGMLSFATAIPAAFTDNYWEETTPHFSRDRNYELDKAIQTWSRNHENITSGRTNVMARAYAALGMKDMARIAETAYGDKKLEEQASMIYDPITLAAGGLGRLVKLGTGALAAERAAEITARGRDLNRVGITLLKELKVAEAAQAVSKTDIATIVKDVSSATGRTLTEQEAMLIALSGTGADMLSDAGKTAASAIKDTIGKSGLSDDLITRIADFSAKASRHSNDVKNAIPGTTGPKRFISGALGGAAGATVEGAGRGVRKLGEFMAEGGSEKALSRWGIRRLMELQPKQIYSGTAMVVAGGGIATYQVFQGDNIWGGASVAAIGATALLRPQYLIAAGGKIETWGAVERRIAQAARSGERVSGSPIRAALNSARTELGKTTDIVRKTAIEAEMSTLNYLVDTGWEQAYSAGFRVAIDNVVHGGTVGLAMAWANDQAAAGNGFGIGAMASTIMSGLNRVTQVANRFANDTTRSKEVIANVSGLLQEMSPDQATRLRTWLNSSTDFTVFLDRADAFRKAYDATGGRIVLNNAAEMEVVNRGINLTPEQIKKIREEANATPGLNDPTARALWAEQRIAELNAKSQNNTAFEIAKNAAEDNYRRVDSTLGRITKIKEQIAAEEAIVAKAGRQSSNSLERLRNDLNNQNESLKVFMAEQVQLDATLAEARNKAEAPIAFRMNETRVNGSGNSVTMVREGMFIEHGPQGGTIHIDITRADAFTARHEAFEALLADGAVRSVMPEMTKVLWNKPTEGGRISPAARSAFFDAYAASLSLEEGKLYREQLKAAQKNYEETGNGYNLERYTKEAMAWWMATIDAQRKPGYGGIGTAKNLTNVRGEGFVNSLQRIMVGERSLADVLGTENVQREFAAIFDPQIGLLPRKYTASAVQSLRESGMRFIAQSDGTVRGFWLNNRGEIVRDPVVNRIYETVHRLTAGKASARIGDLNLTTLTLNQQAGVLQSSGLSHLVDPQTNTPIQGIETPVAPTGGQGGAPGPVVDTYNGQPVQPGVNPPPRPGTPTAGPTPSPTGQPGSTSTAGGTPTPPPVLPTPVVGPSPTPAIPTTPVQVNPSQLPSIRVMAGEHAKAVMGALETIPPNQRGLTFSVDKAGPKGGTKTVIWGNPTPAEIDALSRIQGLPETVRQNIVQIATTMAQGGERPVFRATYANVFSRNKSLYNAERSMIGKDFQFVSERNFVPLYFESNVLYVRQGDGKTISPSEFNALSETKKGEYKPMDNLNVKVFNLDAFQSNKNIMFNEGIRLYSQDGSFSYLKDINGNELNPSFLRQLFRDDTEFFTLANTWFQHYNKGGPIDPTALVAQPHTIVEPSAIVLGNGDRALGEARLTALRAVFGMETRKGRVMVNPSTLGEGVKTGLGTRGLAFPFENLNPTTLGTMVDTGARSTISQAAATRGQFNMAPGSWELRSADFAQQFAGDKSGFNQVQMWTLPNIPNTHIIETSSKGSKWNTYKVLVDGVEVPTGATNLAEAKKAASDAVLKAQDMMDARAAAEKIFKQEATRRAKEQATEDAKQKRTEQERTKSEAALIKEVKGQDAAWLAQAEKMAKLEADLIAQHEAEVAKNTAESQKKAQEIERRLQDIQTERNRINEQLKQDIIARSEAKLKQAGAENETRTTEVDAESKRRSEQLRQDIEARSAQRAKDDATALADALRSNTTELDVGEILRRSLRVDPNSLPVAGDNRLVLRRVVGQKPIVTQTLTAKQQVGPAVDAAQGNLRVARALGSGEAKEATPSLNKYLEQTQVGRMEVIRAINEVWKTEMGNQLHAVYAGLDAKGSPKYVYHLYGINGQELYRTSDVRALYNNMLVNEQRMRGLTTANAPKSKEAAEALQKEVMRQMTPETYLQSQKTTIQRKAEAETANRYR